MLLSEFMQANQISDLAMAMMLNKSRASISRYRRRIEVPSTQTIKQIVAITKGQVTANDLIGIPAAIAAE